MALLDTSIYQNAPGSIVRAGLTGYDQGMAANDAMMQRQAMAQQQARQAGFRQNMQGLLSKYGDSIYTQQGQQGLVRELAQAGYGEEAMGLFGKMPDIPKQAQQEYQFREFGNQAVNFDPRTGKAEAIPGLTKLDAPRDPQGVWAPLPDAAAPTLYHRVTGETKKLGLPGKPPKPDDLKATDIFSQEQQLRNQFIGKTKDFRDVRDAYGRIQASIKQPSAAGDLALIFNYMKMLDPGSTVREGEFATAQNAGGIPERIWSSYNKALSGERLAPSQRSDFASRAKGLYQQQLRQYDKAKFETRKMAQSYPGLNPDRILMDESLAEEQAMPTFEQYDALPSGAEFTDPEGNVRRKP